MPLEMADRTVPEILSRDENMIQAPCSKFRFPIDSIEEESIHAS